MNLRRFDELARQALDPLLIHREGFQFSQGVYHRHLPSLISHLIIADTDTRSRETFRVICGLNSTVLAGEIPANEMGAYHSRYLTGGGLETASRNWSCRNDGVAAESLGRVAFAIEQFALPWFNLHTTLTSLAEALSDEQDYLKGRLYLADGNTTCAKSNFEHYLHRLDMMPATEDVRQARDEVQRVIEGL